MRSYWRSIASALLLGVAAPVSAIAGWARPQDRVWWLGAAGVSACLAGLLQLGDRPRPSESPSSSATLGSGGGQITNIAGPVRTFAGRERELALLRAQLDAAGVGRPRVLAL